MASNRAIDVVKQVYQLYEEEKFDKVVELCSEDTTWTIYGSDNTGVPWIGTFKGREDVKKGFFQAMQRGARVDKWEKTNYIEGKPGCVVVECIWEATMKDDQGEPVQDATCHVNLCHVWEVNKDGKVTSFKLYCDVYEIAMAYRQARGKKA
jgi:ketosteroid isomerase-like protein